MASKLSLPSTLPWSWVIEALSRSNEVDTSLLIDMVKKAPEISDDLGKNSRELVSLRILESLTAKGNRNNNTAAFAEGEKIELDPSNNCEDVLRHVLEQMSTTDCNTVAPEMSNWDVQSFIVHKRASLPLRALQKLKDAILEGSHSILASLKERSGLDIKNQCDDTVPVNGGTSSDLAQRLEESSRSNKVIMPNGNLSSPTLQNKDDKIEENLPDRNLLPARRNMAATTSENLGIQTHEDQFTLDGGCVPLVEAANKYKQDANFNGCTVVENSLASPKHGVLTDTSDGVVGYIGKEERNLEKELQVVGYIGKDGCNLEKEVQVGSSIPQNRDDDLLENLSKKNLVPSKRIRAATSAENLERETCEAQIPLGDDCDPYAVAAKKHKQDANSAVDNVVEDTVFSPVHGLMTISSEGIVEHIEREDCNLERAVQAGGIESNGSSRDGDDQHAGLVQNSNSCHHHHLVPVDDTIVAKMSAELHGQNNDVDKANEHSVCLEQMTLNGTSLGVGIIEKVSNLKTPIHNFEGNFKQNSSGVGEDKDDMEHNPDFNMTSDSDEYHDERIDIALKKDAFLSSQFTYSQDSFATRAKYCVKCNKDGQLLVCSSNTCQLVVHESCLSSAANFDGNGKFYCPFCSYSRAISDYLQLKKKASCARKDLVSFIGSKAERQLKNSSVSYCRAKENQLRENDDLCANNEGNKDEDFVNEISISHCKENVENEHQAEPPISSPVDNPLCGERMVDSTDGAPHMLVKENLEREDMGQECQSPSRPVEEQIAPPCVAKVMDLTDGATHMLVKENLEREDTGQECQSPRGPVEEQVAAHSVHKSDSDCRGPDAIDRKERKARARGKKVSEISETALPHEPACGSITESSDEENEKPATTNYSIRVRKPMKYTYPVLPQLRRKTLPWTKVEEEKLKEGVQRFSSAHERSIPWKKILEFGSDVFQRGRTTIDLKDKWRNICKGSPRSK